MARKAFTLIELLVVISIIALLVGILLPALGAARESAKSLICKAKLKQVAIAHELWLEDSDRLALSKQARGSRWPVVFINRYREEIASPSGGGDIADSTLICPNDPDPVDIKGNTLLDYASYTIEIGGSYYLNNDINSFGPGEVDAGARATVKWLVIKPQPPKTNYTVELWGGDKIDAVRAPSDYALFWDSPGHREFNNEPFTNDKPHAWYFKGDAYSGDDDQPLKNVTPDPERHRGSGNVLFLDSHVTGMTPEEIDYDIIRWDNVNEQRQ